MSKAPTVTYMSVQQTCKTSSLKQVFLKRKRQASWSQVHLMEKRQEVRLYKKDLRPFFTE